MNPRAAVFVLLLFIFLLFASLGLNLYFWQEREPLTAALVAQGTGNAAGQATLVQVMAERRGELSTQQAQVQTAVADREAITAELAAQQATAEAWQRELEAVRGALVALTTPASQAIPATTNPNAPLVRLLQAYNPLTTIQVGQPIYLLGSATHPEGIASFSLAVNGETLLEETPFDVRLHTAALRYVPRTPGEYRFTLVGISTRGRASQPAVLTVQVIPAEADVNTAVRQQIEQNVIALRNLPLLEPIFPTLYTRAELTEQLEADALIALDRDELAQQSLVLSALDFVPPGYDLYEALVPFLTAAVAGYYEPATKQFIVVSEGAVMSQEEQLTYAHEFMHALQDQHFQLALLGQRILSDDANLALRALGEGEAELIEFLYRSTGLLTGETLDPGEFIYGTPEAGNTPDFLVDNFNFPYTRGFDFAYALYNEGGWPRFDEAWARLPQSTEQVLHPEKYLAAEAPQLVSLPPLTDTLGADWALVKENVLGEFYLREYLAGQLPTSTAVPAAAGWGGDQFAVYHQPSTGEVVLMLGVVWDSTADLEEFAAAFATFATNRTAAEPTTPNPTTVCWETNNLALCLIVQQGQTTVVRAPTLDIALRLTP